MKVLTAEVLENGSQFFQIEVNPAQGVEGEPDFVPAEVQEFTWGKDVPLAIAVKEMKALLSDVPEPKQPKALTALVGKDL